MELVVDNGLSEDSNGNWKPPLLMCRKKEQVRGHFMFAMPVPHSECQDAPCRTLVFRLSPVYNATTATGKTGPQPPRELDASRVSVRPRPRCGRSEINSVTSPHSRHSIGEKTARTARTSHQAVSMAPLSSSQFQAESDFSLLLQLPSPPIEVLVRIPFGSIIRKASRTLGWGI